MLVQKSLKAEVHGCGTLMGLSQG